MRDSIGRAWSAFSMTLAEPYGPDTRAPAYQRLLDKLRVAPGVQGGRRHVGSTAESISRSNTYPYREPHAFDGSPVEIIDYYQFVMGDYFETMGVPIVAAAASNRRMRRHQAELSSSTKRWQTGSGKGVTRLGSVCGPTSVRRLVLAITPGIR